MLYLELEDFFNSDDVEEFVAALYGHIVSDVLTRPIISLILGYTMVSVFSNNDLTKDFLSRPRKDIVSATLQAIEMPLRRIPLYKTDYFPTPLTTNELMMYLGSHTIRSMWCVLLSKLKTAHLESVLKHWASFQPRHIVRYDFIIGRENEPFVCVEPLTTITSIPILLVKDRDSKPF